MTYNLRGAVVAVSLALLVTVATQLFYIGVVAELEDGTFLRKVTWMTELAMFSLVAVASLTLVARSTSPLVWSAVAISGLINVIQVAIGLAEFGPAQEAADGAVFQSVLGGAFLLYFHAKALIGLATVGLGLAALKHGGLGKGLGGLSILAGLAAVGANLLAMPNGLEFMMPAGAAGTAATALFALTALQVAKGEAA